MSACASPNARADRQNYRITVTIQTPDGEKVGTAVRRAGIYPKREGVGYSYAISKGEAVAIDIGRSPNVFGERRIIFALLTDDRGVDEGEVRAVFDMRDKKIEGPLPLNEHEYPVLLYFTDRHAPGSVKSLRDMGPCVRDDVQKVNERCVEKDRFEEVLGPGVRLKSITVTLTNDPVTTGIDKYLPWLPLRKDAEFDVIDRRLLQGDFRVRPIEFSSGVLWGQDWNQK